MGRRVCKMHIRLMFFPYDFARGLLFSYGKNVYE